MPFLASLKSKIFQCRPARSTTEDCRKSYSKSFKYRPIAIRLSMKIYGKLNCAIFLKTAMNVAVFFLTILFIFFRLICGKIKVCFAHCCYYCYLYGIFKTMDENFFSYLLTPNPLIPIRTKLRAVLRIKVNIFLSLIDLI